MEGLKEVKKRGRDESDSAESVDTDSPEVKRLREDLLDGLEDDESEFCAASQDLDSFMKSFEEEITASPSSGREVAGHMTSDYGESQPDLGYLLEASDDELGIPPTASSPVGLVGELGDVLDRVESGSAELGSDFWEIPSYDSFGFGFDESNYNGEYVASDGLFEYSDLGFGSDEFAYRPETLPAQ
ncbi:hypothetical protein CASFOL_009832 [Castilleja foliolosa]|uniref:Uncharacterized protein n=1 Tax=Castilleja foliolosa TaxID=1961234 RepID=A0ABD3DRE2_9LAMI